MRLIDLFCGRGGATKGFQAEGWECDGFDLFEQPEYPGRFFRRDILTMTADDIQGYDFAWASSPCEEFSVHCMKHFHPNPKHPEMGIRLFDHARRILLQSGIPYVMENVRCAEMFVGKAVNHCGSFYLWGNAVPAVMPKELYRSIKGFGNMSTIHYSERKPWRRDRASLAAEIPLAISQYIAKTANNCMEAAR